MLLNVAMTKSDKAPPHLMAVPDNEPTKPDFAGMLVSIGKTQDKACFIELFNHFAPRIKSFLIKGGLNIEIADEIAQETMLTIWNKAQSYNPAQAAASTWIFTIARNKRIDHLRKITRHQTQSDENMDFIDESASPIDNTTKRQESENIAAAIKTLPEEQLILIKKSFFEDKSHAAIAEETGIPLGTVKSRIRLALERLRSEKGVKALWN